MLIWTRRERSPLRGRAPMMRVALLLALIVPTRRSSDRAADERPTANRY